MESELGIISFKETRSGMIEFTSFGLILDVAISAEALADSIEGLRPAYTRFEGVQLDELDAWFEIARRIPSEDSQAGLIYTAALDDIEAVTGNSSAPKTIATRLRDAAAALRTRARKSLRDAGADVRFIGLLMVLDRRQTLDPDSWTQESVIGGYLGIDSVGVGKLVGDNLESGLVGRAIYSDDETAKYVMATPRGLDWLYSEVARRQTVGPSRLSAETLRTQLENVTHAETAAFLDEAISCLEARLLRSAIVISWVGAVSILHHHVVKSHLSAFNTEGTRRFKSTWKQVTDVGDLGSMKESDFLDCITAISIIDSNVNKELKKCLILRNTCGHPNACSVGENMVAAHVEALVLNVFTKFA